MVLGDLPIDIRFLKAGKPPEINLNENKIMRWQDTVNGILGIWLIISAFLKFTAQGNLYNYLIVGIIVTILGFWAAYLK